MSEIVSMQKVPTIEEFLDDPFYLGSAREKCSTQLRAHLQEIFSNELSNFEVKLNGPNGVGKTVLAQYGILYQLCCYLLQNQKELLSGMPVCVAICSLSQSSSQILVEMFTRLTQESPFLREQGSRWKMVPASKFKHLLGRNILSVFCKDEESEVYLDCKNRMKALHQGSIWLESATSMEFEIQVVDLERGLNG